MKSLVAKSSILLNFLSLFILRRSLFADKENFYLEQVFRKQKFAALEVMAVQSKVGLLWARVQIETRFSLVQFSGMEKEIEAKIRQHLSRMILDIFISKTHLLNQCWDLSDQFFNQDRYLSQSMKDEFRIIWNSKFDEGFFQTLLSLERNSFFDRGHPKVVGYFPKLKKLLEVHYQFDEVVQTRNLEFVRKEMRIHRELFDKVEKDPLSLEQRQAAVYFEDVNLLVASAGSGKTSSLVGKAVYAITRKLYQPSEILMLAFASKAATGLKSRLDQAFNSQQAPSLSPAVSTFHALGRSIIQTVEMKNPSTAPWSSKESLFKENLAAIVEEVCLDSLVEVEFKTLVSTLMYGGATNFEQRLFYDEIFQDLSLGSLEMKSQIREKAGGLKTLKGDMVRSYEELMIANWLYSHGIKYEYEIELTLEDPTEDAKRSVRFYPDFYYPDAQAYHEHFALNHDGSVPAFIGDEYISGVNWKRQIFAKSNTRFFETRSCMFMDSTIFEKLTASLNNFGLNPQRKKLESYSAEFTEAHNSLLGLIATSIKHIRNQGRSAETLEIIPTDPLSKSFNKIVRTVLRKYEQQLAETRVIDFEEMLIKAARYVERGNYKSPYKFICIDEFQDLNQGQRRLIKSLLDQQKGTTFFAVGDDWQAIYRFAGADLDIFTRTSKYFGKTEELYLTNTFRSNQGIANISSEFIMKNPIQKKKSVRANDSNTQNVIEILQYSKEFEDMLLVQGKIVEIATYFQELNSTATILILFRYKHQEPHQRGIDTLVNQCKGAIRIRAMTVHASKGQEADFVFILGMNSGPMGFPSLKNDHPFIQMYMPEPDPYPASEERRLFYVALTRARKKVYLVTRKGIASSFLDELLESPKAQLHFRR